MSGCSRAACDVIQYGVMAREPDGEIVWVSPHTTLVAKPSAMNFLSPNLKAANAMIEDTEEEIAVVVPYPVSVSAETNKGVLSINDEVISKGSAGVVEIEFNYCSAKTIKAARNNLPGQPDYLRGVTGKIPGNAAMLAIMSEAFELFSADIDRRDRFVEKLINSHAKGSRSLGKSKYPKLGELAASVRRLRTSDSVEFYHLEAHEAKTDIFSIPETSFETAGAAFKEPAGSIFK